MNWLRYKMNIVLSFTDTEKKKTCFLLKNVCLCWVQMIDDQDLGFIVNFLGIFIFALVIACHYVAADPKYEAT